MSQGPALQVQRDQRQSVNCGIAFTARVTVSANACAAYLVLMLCTVQSFLDGHANHAYASVSSVFLSYEPWDYICTPVGMCYGAGSVFLQVSLHGDWPGGLHIGVAGSPFSPDPGLAQCVQHGGNVRD